MELAIASLLIFYRIKNFLNTDYKGWFCCYFMKDGRYMERKDDIRNL